MQDGVRGIAGQRMFRWEYFLCVLYRFRFGKRMKRERQKRKSILQALRRLLRFRGLCLLLCHSLHIVPVKLHAFYGLQAILPGQERVCRKGLSHHSVH